MQKIRWFFLIAGIVLALAMAVQNNDPAEIQLLWLKQSLPLSLLLLSTLAIGFLLGALMTASMLRRRRDKSKKAAPEPEREPTPAPAPSNPSS